MVAGEFLDSLSCLQRPRAQVTAGPGRQSPLRGTSDGGATPLAWPRMQALSTIVSCKCSSNVLVLLSSSAPFSPLLSLLPAGTMPPQPAARTQVEPWVLLCAHFMFSTGGFLSLLRFMLNPHEQEKAAGTLSKVWSDRLVVEQERAKQRCGLLLVGVYARQAPGRAAFAAVTEGCHPCTLPCSSPAAVEEAKQLSNHVLEVVLQSQLSTFFLINCMTSVCAVATMATKVRGQFFFFASLTGA